MNPKSKSKKGKEKGIVGITLAAIMIASIFAAINPVPVSAVGLSLEKDTYPNTGQSYRVGDLVNYTLLVDNPATATYNFTVNVTDTFPNGTSVELESSITLAPGEDWTHTYMGIYEVTPSDAANGTIENTLSVYGWNEKTPSPELVKGSITKISDVITDKPKFDITWEQICCKNISFNGSASNASSGFKNHTWDFDHGTPITKVGAPGVITHLYSSCGPKDVNLSGYDNDGNFNSTVKHIWVDCGPVASAKASPFCYEANGTQITFNGSASEGDPLNPFQKDIIWWKWTFSDGGIGSSDDAAATTRDVNATLTAKLEVSDGCCNATTNVTVKPCSRCKIRIYGTFDEGPGDLTVTDREPGRSFGLRPENPPYTDPVGPFHPQHPQAPRKDFITFNPAIMDHNQAPPGSDDFYDELDFDKCDVGSVQRPQEKVFKRMWYEKEWFKDHDKDGCWDVVIDKYNAKTGKYEYEMTMCLKDWNKIPAWEKEEQGLTIREWNNDPTINDSNVDIYGPAIKQEFAYMFLDDERMPIMIEAGSEVLIPMAHQPTNAYRGLNSFDADGDGARDALRVESEATLGLDIDHDGLLEPMDGDGIELSGDETLVLVLGNKYLKKGASIQLFDHIVTLKDVYPDMMGGHAILDVCDNEGGGSQRCEENVVLWLGDVDYFYRGKHAKPNERPAFYLRLVAADAPGKTAIIEVGRMFGQTYANIGANQYWSQKAFIVDEVFYNAVAIKAVDNCTKYIVFRQKLPKLPIKLYGKHLKVWNVGEVLPEMSPFNLPHEVIVDVQDTWTRPRSQQDKIGPKEARPPLEITYTKEAKERRYKGELKEIYNESHIRWQIPDEWWELEWYWTLPWQYTEFRLPADDKYLVTLSWFAPESEITLWDGDYNKPVANYTGERLKFWYQDCSGPLYIDANQSSIRIFGTFGEGAGDPGARDIEPGPSYWLKPENQPYTDPRGPFEPQHWQAPKKDFMTFNPAIMDHNQGYPELDFDKCDEGSVQRPQEKVFKRMWYEKEWFKDHDKDGCWDVVVEQYDDVEGKWKLRLPNSTMCLDDWNAIPEWIKVTDKLRIREWNNDVRINDSNVDIYGPAIIQEFTYMALDDERMPIMIEAGSEVLIPMAHYDGTPYRGINSFDADGDGVRDALTVQSEATLGLDIDGDGWPLERMDNDGWELSGDETLVLVLENKEMELGGSIQLFDHIVTLKDVYPDMMGGHAILDVCDNEGGSSQRCERNVVLWLGDVDCFYRGKYPNPNEHATFCMRLVAADSVGKKAIIDVGRMFGQTYANIGANQYWSQKAFIVDEVFYNVVAIKAVDDCVKYITFRQKLPKLPIKLYGKHLEWDWKEKTLPEMPPFNEEHEILIDVQPTWTRPYSQQDKIGPKKTDIPPLNITYVEEGHEMRFKGELKEIYNESFNDTCYDECIGAGGSEKECILDCTYEYWNLEWFHTKPQQYTAFVMPEGHGLYLMTLAWRAPEAEITIWDHDPNGPVANYTGERVKFWYDPADNRDIYINRVGEDHEIPPAWMSNMTLYYDMASHGGNGDGIIDLDEVINAIMDYLTDAYPFGPTGPDAPFNKDGLIGYILDYLAKP